MTVFGGAWSWTAADLAIATCRRLARNLACEDEVYNEFGDGLSFIADNAATQRPPFEPSIAIGGDVFVVGDLRIDNRDELLAGLPAFSRPSAVCPDIVLFEHIWRQWGPDSFLRVIGDFAVALFDRRIRRLYLVRDFAGQRPLHYRETNEGVAFASTPAALARLSGPPQLDRFEWAAYVAVVPQSSERTLFSNVKRVKPGHFVAVDRGVIHPQSRYWSPDLTPLRIGFAEAVEQGRHLLDQAVRAQLRDRHGLIAGQLSSGLDSGAVMTSAARISSKRLLALTGGLIDAGPPPPVTHHAGEGRYAAMIAGRYTNLEHRNVDVSTGPLFDEFVRWNALLDQPVRSFENMAWLDATFRAASEAGAGVMLTGLYGNFSLSFDGIARFAELFRAGRFLDWFRESAKFKRQSGARWRGMLAYSAGPFVPVRQWRWLDMARGIAHSDALADAFLRPENSTVEDLRARVTESGFSTDTRPSSSTLQDRLLGTQWVDNAHLTHAFRRRWKVESRDPTHDRRVVEFTLRLPSEIFLHEGRPRSLGREMLRGRVSDEILDLKTRGIQGNDWRRSAMASRDDFAREIDRLEAVPAIADMLDLPRMRAVLHRLDDESNDMATIIAVRGSFLRSLGLAHFARTRFFD